MSRLKDFEKAIGIFSKTSPVALAYKMGEKLSEPKTLGEYVKYKQVQNTSIVDDKEIIKKIEKHLKLRYKQAYYTDIIKMVGCGKRTYEIAEEINTTRGKTPDIIKAISERIIDNFSNIEHRKPREILTSFYYEYKNILTTHF